MANRALLGGILVIGLLSGLISQGTFARFTSEAASSENHFSAGTLALAAGLAAGSRLSVGDLVPGDHITAQLTVQNSGTLPASYAMSVTTSGEGPLASALQLTIRAKTALPCAAQEGAVLYGPGSLATAAMGNLTARNPMGRRILGPGASEDLCFAVRLPEDAARSL